MLVAIKWQRWKQWRLRTATSPSGTTSTIQISATTAGPIRAQQRGYTPGHPCPAQLCQKTGGCSRARAPKEAQGSDAGSPGTSSTWNKQERHQHISECLIHISHSTTSGTSPNHSGTQLAPLETAFTEQRSSNEELFKQQQFLKLSCQENWLLRYQGNGKMLRQRPSSSRAIRYRLNPPISQQLVR